MAIVLASARQMAITRKDVLHVARLARLDLEEHEIEPMVRDLDRILEYFAELGELDTRDVVPTASVAVEATPLRPDAVAPSLDHDIVLGQAPQIAEDGFAVPAFVDEA